MKRLLLVAGLLVAGLVMGFVLRDSFATWEHNQNIKYSKPDYVKEAEAEAKLKEIQNGE